MLDKVRSLNLHNFVCECEGQLSLAGMQALPPLSSEERVFLQTLNEVSAPLHPHPALWMPVLPLA